MTSKATSLQNAITTIEQYKRDGKKVIFTNGCFDIIHPGHIAYLEDAKALGDILVVGLNTDHSVKLNKGPSRPIIPEEDRAYVMQALKPVDMVVFFNEKTPETLIQTLKPNIHTKGGDYNAQDLPEYSIIKAYGGDVTIIPFREGFSSTNIIEKIIQGQN